MQDPLVFLARAAIDFGGTVTQESVGDVSMVLPIEYVDGQVDTYRLWLTATGTKVSAREITPQHLPAFCPERHINPDGSFCLSYAPADLLGVVDAESATAWMQTLWQFLVLQRRAKRLRRWPSNNVWAHGRAALHQMAAENAAMQLGPKLVSALQRNTLEVVPRKSVGRGVLDVYVDRRHVFSVWSGRDKFVNANRRCFCGARGLKRPLKVRSCSDHGQQAVLLARALHAWKQEEQQFWREMKGRPCCGKCDACPLSTT